jgi:ABC-type multidrug transport system fused ATPase/permease subunit
MEHSIFKYILRYSRRQQINLTILAAVSFPFVYAFYELPKQIINKAIQANPEDFPRPFELFGIDFSAIGIPEVGQLPWLFSLCALFLVLVVINQGFKYVINVYKGLTGERMLRRLRFDLYSRVLRFPKSTFRNMSQGEIIPMITAEVEPLGGFIGDAYSQPAFQGGQLLVILGFLFLQDWRMAAAAVALYPLQLYVIPKLQRRVNLLGKERVKLVRQLSDRIGETVNGVEDVHVHDASRRERAEFGRRLGTIFNVRYKIYRQKFVIKFLNNFIQQLGPFFFYSIGGYLAIKGQLEVGTLVAAITAHKDLAAPWKELLNYYQQQADARIKYEVVVSQFEPAGILDAEAQEFEPETATPLQGTAAMVNVTLYDDQETAVVDGASVEFPLDQRIGLMGSPGSGREDVAMLLARLARPSAGSITIGGTDIATAPEAIIGRRMSYIGLGGFVFAATIGDNLYYGLRHRQMGPNPSDEQAALHEAGVSEAKAAGNSTDDVNAEWTDYAAAGTDGPDALAVRALDVLDMVELTADVYQFGLRGTIDPAVEPELASAVLRARARLRERVDADESASHLVERFDPALYNANATVGENLLFGNPVGDAFNMDRLGENAYVLEVLDKASLTETMLQTGHQVAATMVELFADLPPDHEFFQQFSFISSEDLPLYQAILGRVGKAHLDQLKPDERGRLMSLPFLIIPARHRLGIVTEEFQAQILDARRVFAENLPEDLSGAIQIYDPDNYIGASNLQDNILFGKVSYGEAEAASRVGQLLSDVIEETNLHETVVRVGLNFHVGIAGTRLTPAQRQKLILARSVIKRPDLMVVSEGLSALDPTTLGRLAERLVKEFEGRSLVWLLQQPDLAALFDRVVVMRSGKMVKSGTYEELNAGDGLAKLIEEKVS